VQRADDPTALIGNTPLVYLRALSERTGARIWGKCEFQNPSGSVKDRPAQRMVLEAERRGELRPGGTIVEGTAGNTGIGLALMAASRGYRCIFVIPDTMSPGKVEFARLLGAEVRLVPKAEWSDPAHYTRQARDIAASIDGGFWSNQFDNLDNLAAHYATTGPEIWEQTEGKVDAVIMGSGTGGTISGVGRFLKERNPQVRVVVADPPGSALRNFVKTGRAEAEGSSIVEGVGITRIPANFDREVIDDAIAVPDQESVDEAYRLLWEEGLYVGGSTGLSLAGAVRYARGEGRGKTLVCNLCDGGLRYSTNLYDADWLQRQGLRAPQRRGSAPRG